MAPIKPDRARRIALAAQGFNDPRPRRVDVRQLRRALDRMTVLQLDSVNVLCRSHYLPFLARVGPYDRARLDELINHSGEYWEYLSHEASITAQANQPLLRHKAEEIRWKSAKRFAAENPGYMKAVHDEVAEHGPISIKGLSDPGERNGPWWGIPKGKLALEYLYCTANLCISHRDHQFISYYDLPERVIAPEVLALPTPPVDDARRAKLLLSARSHGIGTASDLADYFRLKVTVARPLLEDLVASGELEKVEVEGWDEPAYLDPEASQPRSITGGALLSPFDPVVWFRPRAERLFNFFYRIEIYVPAPKRVYGYYVLPFLLDGDLVGRVDLKADRAGGRLLVRAAHIEEGERPDRVVPALADALREMAGWLELGSVEVEDRGSLAKALRSQSSL